MGLAWRSVLAASVLYSDAAVEALEGCKLSPWLSEGPAAGEDGFHVLCVFNTSLLHLWRGGVASKTPTVLHLNSDIGLRRKLAEELGIRDTIRYQTTKGMLEWRKQPWTLFTAQGGELRPGRESKILDKTFEKARKPVTVLLFEGGVWRWPTMHIGYKRKVMPGIFLTTVSRQPALFEVSIEADKRGGEEDHLRVDLLANVIELSKRQLEPSSTEGKVVKQMRSSYQTFLSYDENSDMRRLHAGTAKLLRAPRENLHEFQVLRYTEGQHYDAHRDYWDPREFPDVPRFTSAEGFWQMRHATLLWYLSGPDAGGETWFPRAHGGPVPYGEWMACDSRGAKVSPRNATAVLFYSLRADGDIDEYSWHCGCPVTSGVKWAANSWLSNTPVQMRAAERRPDHLEL